jgi:hypothetical protein
LAVTATTALTVTMQAPMPPHAPPQPTKLESGSAVAVSETIAPAL